MAITVNRTNLRNVLQQQESTTVRALVDYYHLTRRVFSFPLPAQGKLLEIAKRLTVIAAPIILPSLCILAGITSLYWSIGEGSIKRHVDATTRHFCTNHLTFADTIHGNYRMVVLFHLKVAQRDIYTDMIELNDPQEEHTLSDFVPEIIRHKEIIDLHIENHAFYHLGNQVDIRIEGFIANPNGTYRKIHADCFNRLAYQPVLGFGGREYTSRANLVIDFNRILDEMHPVNRIAMHNFASHFRQRNA